MILLIFCMHVFRIRRSSQIHLEEFGEHHFPGLRVCTNWTEIRFFAWHRLSARQSEIWHRFNFVNECSFLLLFLTCLIRK
jgi:hypothetical protein